METFQAVQSTFQEVFGSLPMPVFLIDRAGAIGPANASFLALTRSAPEDLPALSLPPFPGGVTRFLDSDRGADLPEPFYTDFSDRQGRATPVRLTCRRLTGPGNEVTGAIVFLTDLRDLKQSDEKRKLLAAENAALKKQLSGERPDEALLKRTQLEQDVQDVRDFLENVLESSGDGIMVVDSTARITRVNWSFAAMLGKEKSEIVGTYTYELGPWEGTYQSSAGEMITLDKSYQDRLSRRMENNIFRPAGGLESGYAEFYAFHKNGDIVPLELTTAVQKGADGSVVRGVSVARDITEHKRAEKEIRQAKEFLENVLESCGDGIFITDGQGRMTRVNDSFAALLGKSKHELEGLEFWQLGPTEGTFQATTGERVTIDMEASRQSRAAHFEKGFLKRGEDITLENVEYYVFDRSGTIVPLELTLTFQFSDAGEIRGAVGAARNITERKKAEKALQEAQEYRRQFFTNMTHEFRTPLTLAIGPLEGILRGEFGQAAREMKAQLSVALRNSRQMLKLVNQLLDFSQLEAGAEHLVYEKRDLREFIASVLDAFASVAKRKKIKLELDATGDLSGLGIDPGKVEKVLFNLLGNAFKFTPPKGRIQVALGRGSDWQAELAGKGTGCRSCPADFPEGYVKIAVTDTGIGIKDEDLPLIFDRYRQAGAGPDRELAGTGIGLAYARELTEFMGGCISAQSRYGQGSVFTVYLPATEAPAESEAPAAEVVQYESSVQTDVQLSDVVQPEAEAPEAHITGKRPLVLIVDDNQDVRRYVAGILDRAYDFMTAQSGQEGLLRLEAQRPDAILCDIMMPEMDGYEFLKHVRQAPGLQAVPFVFLTAKADIEMKIEGLEVGADDYITKPFNSQELLARIGAQLRLRELLKKTEDQEKQIVNLNQKLQGRYAYGNIVGSSPPMRKIYQVIEALKDSDASVLVTGETGTGKELIANAIHYNSPRRTGPMVSVNCGAIPRELIERELFGHVKGAFTGATESRKGYFTEADQGTLFLDEIGEMDRDMQVKLLRVLERGEVLRVGDTRPLKTDVRLIAATNKNLLAEVQQGRFREDLYYRIHVIPVHLPPLRQRREDLPALMDLFLNEFKQKQSRPAPPLTEKDLALFMEYDYPGNVRELKHLIERFCLLGGKAASLFAGSPELPFPAAGLPAAEDLLEGPKPLKAAARKAKAAAERQVLEKALALCNYDYSLTAQKLNICLASLYNKINDYGLARRGGEK